MFTIKSLGQDVDGIRPICSGVTFGFRDLKLVFEISVQKIPDPLKVKFFVKNDKKKKLLEYEIGEINNNELDICFYNVPETGVFGVKLPTSILTLEENILALMFTVESIADSPCYKMNYEFYHGNASIKGGGK